VTGLELRLLGYALLAAALAGGWSTVTGWRSDSQRLRVVQQEYTAYRSTIEGYAKGEAKVRQEYADDRAATTRVRSGVPVQPVRLCVDGPGRREPAATGDTAAVGTPAAPARELQEAGGLPDPGSEGPDIAPRLYGLWDDADDLRDDFAACQRDLALLRDSWPQCPPALPERRRWWQMRR
jgi:hypothetical protein